MQPIAEQLDAVRRRARALLVARRVFQFVAVAAPAALGLGVIDYLLRLPGGLRLVVGLALLVVAGGWLLGRLGRAFAFAPSLSELALRTERLFPDLRGLLTSGLELSTPAPGSGVTHEAFLSSRESAPASFADAGPVSAGLSSVTVAEAQRRAAGLDFGRLIDARSTRKCAGAALLGALVLLCAVLVSPASAKIAAQRWLLPLGDTEWPRRVAVELLEPPIVVAADTPVDLRAVVTRGHAEGMRVWLRYRFEHQPADGLPAWRSAETDLLMIATVGDGEALTPTDPPVGEDVRTAADTRHAFAAQVDPPAELMRRLSENPGGGRLVYRVEASDDATDEAAVPVVPRPTLTAVAVTVTPPAYARPYLATQRLTLDPTAERLGTVTALAGADVAVELRFNKLLSKSPAVMRAWFDGLPADAALIPSSSERLVADANGGTSTVANATVDRLTLRLPAEADTTLRLLIADEHGLTDSSPRQLRLVVTPDALPTVTLFEPATDQSVLPTAVVPVRAEAEDDVSLTQLLLLAVRPDRDVAPPLVVEAPAADAAEPTRVDVLAEAAELRRDLSAALDLDLATLEVRPGDTVELRAVARDLYASDASPREAASAIPRRLTIIDAATLMSEVQRELAAVRRAAERLRAEQATLRRSEPPALTDLAEPQARITRGMRPPSQRLEEVSKRLQQNRLSEPELDALIDRAGQLLEQAADASEAARQTFGDAEQPDEDAGRAAQQAAEDKLAELTELLDQGGDALSLRLEVAGLRAEQENLALDTRQLLPQTAGRSMEELTDAQREAVERLAERQQELAERAEDLVRRLASTAESLAQQSERDADQAAAEALAEAADTARQQGLAPTMQGSAADAQENQLSQAGQQQLDALDTLDRMLEQIGQQEQKRRERLQRRLRQLAERIERLIRDQTVALDRLKVVAADAVAVAALAEPEAALWQRIIAVQTAAEAAAETADVAPILGEAAGFAAESVAALREPDADAATQHEGSTIEALERALEAVREAQEKQAQDDAERQRAELRQAYLDLADKQDELTEKAAPVLDKPQLDRRDRATLRTLAGEQAAIGDEASQLQAQVEGQLVFEHMHRRIETLVSGAAGAMQTAENTARVGLDQAQIAATLRAMADALTPPPKSNDFQDSGGGGGGGGGGGQQEMIPPAAQLKLLRAEQSMLLEETRVAAELLGAAGNPGDAAQQAIDALAGRQRELTDLAERLKQALEERRREQPVIEPRITPPGDDVSDDAAEEQP